MTTIDRTAYPQFRQGYSKDELQTEFELSTGDARFIAEAARGAIGRLTLAVMLVCRRRLGLFPVLHSIPPSIVDHVTESLGLPNGTKLFDEKKRRKSLFSYRSAIRNHIGARYFDAEAATHLRRTLREAAETMSDPADLISRAVELLRELEIDLPAFSRLDRITASIRVQVHRHLFTGVANRLIKEVTDALDELLIVPEGEHTTPFNRLKQPSGPARLKYLRAWSERLHWLEQLPGHASMIDGIKASKRRQFAAEAAMMEVSELLDIREQGKRHTLLICFIEQTRARCRDEIIEMFLRRIRRTQAAAREKLAALREKHQALEETLIAILHQTLVADRDGMPDRDFGRRAREIFANHGGAENLVERCETVGAWHDNNYLPLLWAIHKPHRAAIFRLLKLIDIRPASQDETLIRAWQLVLDSQRARGDDLPVSVDLSFLSERWRTFVLRKRNGNSIIDRRRFEVCMMIHIAHALECADVFVIGSDEFPDGREQLLPWEDCREKLAGYCQAVGLPATAGEFVATLRARLHEVATTVDNAFPDNAELSIDAMGMPHLKQLARSSRPKGQAEFERQLQARMPERHLLDILRNVEHWTSYTRHFGPPSGSDPKLANATMRYLFTVFGYGCNLGPTQTARHAADHITHQALRRINASHVTDKKLEAAGVDVINAYSRFELPKLWGAGMAAIADGTHIVLRDNNLTRSRHFRYGAYGGVAYNHIADSYIALFTTFIPCGVWEAVHILDGLLQNRSEIQPDTLHADTQGQNEPVFGLGLLLGIKLMPRIRGWADLTFYRASPDSQYAHIDRLFSATIDWKLIETHWADIMQVALSIQAGTVTPSMLLRRLGSQNRKSRLYRALRELGRVERTIFLLRYISDADVRRHIRAETTKIESFNDFLDWISFGGPVLKSGDPVEHDKQVRYANLVANAVMLSNVVDLTDVMNDMTKDRLPVTPELAAAISPYMRDQIRRFGRFDVDMDDLPKPITPARLPFKIPL